MAIAKPKRLKSMEDFLKLDLRFQPVLPAREVAVVWLCDAGFDMFESDEEGLVAYGNWGQVDRIVLADVLERIKEIEGLVRFEYTEERVEAENWNAQWESAYEPIDVEGRACMRAPFHTPPEKGLDLIIQPQMSFGTGHHPTTWMMLRHLLDLPCHGKAVLDMGCGTGVLAIAAHKLGAKQVWGVDIDEWSFQNTLSNLQLNGLEAGRDGMEVRWGGAEVIADLDASVDLILANINRNVLTKDWPAYDRALKPGGLAVMSGFFPEDIPILQASAQKVGWLEQVRLERGEWASVVWAKPVKP